MADPADELWNAIACAPTFGSNARALILAAAAKGDDEEGREGEDEAPLVDGAETPSADAAEEAPPGPEPKAASGEAEAWVRSSLASAMRMAPSALKSVAPQLRPQIAYVSRSRLPRATRQIVLSRLAGQHLAVAGCAAWVRETLAEREEEEDEQGQREKERALGGEKGQDASPCLSPPLPALEERELLAHVDSAELRDRAFACARAQELELFRASLTASGYTTRCSRVTALEWADAGAEDVAEEAASRVAGRAKARRRAWERRSEAAGRPGKRRRDDGGASARPARQRPSPALEEVDLIGSGAAAAARSAGSEEQAALDDVDSSFPVD